MHIGEKVSLRRRAKQWTQDELARAAAVPQSVISRIERGESKNPTMDVVRRLAQALGVTTDYLVGMYEPEDTARQHALAGAPGRGIPGHGREGLLARS